MNNIARLARSRFSTAASSQGTKKELKKFFVYAPDRPGALDRRYEARPRHFEKVNPLIESGVIQVAGMITDPETPVVEGERRNAIGSMLIVQAESIEAARELIMNDVYTTSGVWDKEKMVIAPFFAATPFLA